MPEINFNSLKDKALDVDPDLRFMALEDFKKHLNEPSTVASSKNIESFIPILFRLLKDTNANVQSQAVKSFSPIIKYISSESVLKVLDQLYDEILKENATNDKDYKKITTSIPNMTLRSIFNSNFKFSNRLSRSIVDSLIPKLITNSITIDSIELLIDLIKNMGAVLREEEVMSLLTTTMNIAFDEESIIGKRSIISFDLLLRCLSTNEISVNILNELVQQIILKFDSMPINSHSIGVRLTLFSVLLNSIKNFEEYDGSILNDRSIHHIYSIARSYMKVDDLDTELDVEDYDYDLMVQENLIREYALNTINDLINSLLLKEFQPYLEETVKLIQNFINYDPLNFENHDDDDIESDDEEDIEFSDDEDDINNNDDYENDCSWKLRGKSAILTRSLINRYPSILSIVYKELFSYLADAMNDRNDLVSNDSIRTLISIINGTSTNQDNDRYAYKQYGGLDLDVSMNLDSSNITELFMEASPVLESKIFNSLLVSKKIGRFPIFLKLIESLITTNHELSTEYLDKIFHALRDLNLRTSGNMEYLSLYKTIFLNNKLADVGEKFVNYILNDLSTSINNTASYHNVIMESLNISIIIFKNFDKIENLKGFESSINELFNSIIKICHNKQYSSELRQKSISAVTELNINIKVNEDNFNKTISLLKESLNYEVTVKVTIENLINILNKECKNFWRFLKEIDFINFLIKKLIAFVSSTDDSLFFISLKLLDIITDIQHIDNMEHDQANRMLSVLIQFGEKTNDYTQLYLLFNIVGKILPNCQIDQKFFHDLISKIINVKLTDVDDFDISSFEFLIKQLSRKFHKEDLSQLFFDSLNLKLFISAKTLSIIAIENRLHDKINESEIELNNYINNEVTVSNDKILFDIQFLGNIGSQSELHLITLESFLKLLENRNEAIRLASSRSIGLLIFKDLHNDLPLLLNNYESNESERDLNLISMKQLLKNEKLDGSTLLQIWDKIWEVVCTYDEKKVSNTSELRLAGDVLSRICLMDNRYITRIIDHISIVTNESVIYTIIVVSKQLIYKLNDNNRVLLSLLVGNLRFLTLTNIEIKQALIGTILTGLHNKPDLVLPILRARVLPLIYDELSAKDHFKKIIPMGPYKYVMDEGLEIRKLCYELLYSIILMDVTPVRANDVDLHEVGRNIVDKGLTDNEPDIVILSSINLINLINNDFSFLLHSDDVLNSLIDVLNRNLSKKLKSKASTQETENFEESLKAVIRLSKAINSCLLISNYNNNEWTTYYGEMKTNFILTFNAVEH